MSFDIHRRPFDADGELDEDAVELYCETLMERFADSPEGRSLRTDEAYTPGWSQLLLQYGFTYLGVGPADMTPAQVAQVVFDILPRKVSADPREGPGAVKELHAFWQFLGREFRLPQAKACAALLEEEAGARLQKVLADPTRWGMAKSFFMMGQAAGFDMTTQEGLDAWARRYNETQLPAGQSRAAPPRVAQHRTRDAEKARKEQRKRQKASRRRNR